MYHPPVLLSTILGKHLMITRRRLHAHYKVMLWQNWKYSRKMWTPASANLTWDFIKTGLHHEHIVAECSDISGGKLFHKIALIACKSVFLFSEPNQILIAFIGLRRASPWNRNIRRKLFQKKVILKNFTNFTEKKVWRSPFLKLATSAFLRRTPVQVFSCDIHEVLENTSEQLF